jgi:hypothetical protein
MKRTLTLLTALLLASLAALRPMGSNLLRRAAFPVKSSAGQR